jgi:hypothetical protein
MSALDDYDERIKQQMDRQMAEIHRLQRLILWQAERGPPEGSWVRQPSTSNSTLSIDQARPTDESQPLVWVPLEVSRLSCDILWAWLTPGPTLLQNKRDRPARSTPRLPSELLAEIASDLDVRRDLVSLGKASFQLLEIAMHELMVKRPVCLEEPKQMEQFFCHRVRPPLFCPI